MYRRDFLRATGLVSGAFLLHVGSLAKAASLPNEAESQGKLYRASAGGKIDVSADAGKSWQVHSDFGTGFAIVGLAADRRGQVRAQLVSGASRFELALVQSGKAWTTV